MTEKNQKTQEAKKRRNVWPVKPITRIVPNKTGKGSYNRQQQKNKRKD